MAHEFQKTPLNKVKRLPEKGQYDAASIYAVVDAALICSVGYVIDGQVYVTPTMHARDGDQILLHGSRASRMLRHLDAGGAVCISVTIPDALVLARSIFEHSMNYRSATLFGHGTAVVGDAARLAALQMFSERMIPGRWNDARQPDAGELKQTTIVAVPIESASAKIADGMPTDNDADMDYPVWAGIIPMRHLYGVPVPDPRTQPVRPLPEYLRGFASE